MRTPTHGALLRACLVALVAGLALTVGANNAQAGWSTPVDQTSGNGAAASTSAKIAYAPDGSYTVLWVNGTTVQMRRFSATGVGGSVVSLSASGGVIGSQQIAYAADGSSTAVWSRVNNSKFRIQAVRISATGTVGTVTDVSIAGENAQNPYIAYAPNGSATITWYRSASGAFEYEYARVTAGGSFGSPVLLEGTSISPTPPQVAYASDNSSTIVWNKLTSSYTLIRMARFDTNGDPISTSTLSTAFHTSLTPQVAYASDKSATVAWSEFLDTNYVIRARRIAADGTAAAEFSVSGEGSGAATSPSLAYAPNGSAVVAWERLVGNHLAQARRIGSDGSLGTIATLSDTGQDASQPSVAAGAGNGATVVWRRSNGTYQIAQASQMSSGGTFGSAVNLSATGQDAYGPAVAYSPTTGVPTAIWDRSNGSIYEIQASTYTDPNIDVSPTSINFGSQRTGTSSSTQHVTVTSNGTTNLTLGSISLTGANSADYSLDASACTGSLAPAATCQLDIHFAPSTIGAKSASIQIASDAPGSPTSIPLTGTGVAPAVTVDPTSHGFGSKRIGESSSDQGFTVTSTGTASLTLGSISLGGTDQSQFTMDASECAGQTLAVAQSCVIHASFVPNAVGAASAQISVASDAPSSPEVLLLSGTGVDPQASTEPTSLNFGERQIGTSSDLQVVTLTSSGQTDLAVGSISFVGDGSAEYSLDSSDCPATLAPTETCEISVQFSPTNIGLAPTQLRIVSDSLSSPAGIGISGTGIDPGIEVDPSSLDFGEQQIDTDSGSETVTITSSGTTVLSLSSISITGTDGNQFSVDSADCGATLQPTESCELAVQFSPTSVGSKGADLSIASDAPGSPLVLALNGSGVDRQLGISPGSLSFGSQQIGTDSDAQTLTVTSTGQNDLAISSVSLVGDSADQFTVDSSDCPGTLAPDESCEVNVQYSPTNIGGAAAQVEIASDAADSPSATDVTGNGVNPGIEVDPTSLSFGSQQVNTDSTEQTVTITSNGTTALSFSSFSITGLGASQFSVDDSDCQVSLGPSQSCELTVQFSPTSVGAKGAELNIASDAPGSPLPLSLAGAGVDRQLEVDPGSLSFGSQQIGTGSSNETLTLTGSGETDVTLGAISLVGDGAGEYSLDSSDCSGTLAPDGSCELLVEFSPSSIGAAPAAVRVVSDAVGSPRDINISGTGVDPAVEADPLSIDFGDQPEGSDTGQQTVTVTSTGTSPLSINSVSLGGADDGEFALDSSDCVGAFAPAESCELQIVFSPTAAGSASAQVNIATDAPGSPLQVALSGNGIAAADIDTDPTSLNFGSQQVGTAATEQTVTVANNGGLALTLDSISLDGADASEFTLDSSGCPSTLAASQTCQLQVGFEPSTARSASAQIKLASNDPDSPTNVGLSGMGTPAPNPPGPGPTPEPDPEPDQPTPKKPDEPTVICKAINARIGLPSPRPGPPSNDNSSESTHRKKLEPATESPADLKPQTQPGFRVEAKVDALARLEVSGSATARAGRRVFTVPLEPVHGLVVDGTRRFALRVSERFEHLLQRGRKFTVNIRTSGAAIGASGCDAQQGDAQSLRLDATRIVVVD